jgi:hypothetical protein
VAQIHGLPVHGYDLWVREGAMGVFVSFRAYLLYCIVVFALSFWLGQPEFQTCSNNGGQFASCAAVAILMGLLKLGVAIYGFILGCIIDGFSHLGK